MQTVIEIILASENHVPKSIDVVTFVNTVSFLNLVNDDSVCLEKLGVIYVDGFYAKIILEVLSYTSLTRRSLDMTSLAKELLSRPLKIGLIGGTRDELERASHILSDESPVKFFLISHGYVDFNDSSNLNEIADAIMENNLDTVFVGLGSTLQERVSIELSKRTTGVIYYTCGGFLSQTAWAGVKNYYPEIIDKLNLRWLFRLYKEPHTIKRIPTIFTFVYYLLIWKILTFKAKP